MNRRYDAVAVLFAGLVLAPAAMAGPREDVMMAASRCFSLVDDRAWLECYHAAARPMETTLGTAVPPPRTDVSPLALAATPPSAPEKIMLNRPVPTGNDVDHVTARLTNIRFVQDGYVIITLANGDVWQQVDGNSLRQPLKKSAGTYVATISRGLFGTYNLAIRGIAGKYGVKRVR